MTCDTTLPASQQSVDGNVLAIIAATTEKISADHGLPALQVVKFNGSPENYPVFRQSFRQMAKGFRGISQNGPPIAIPRRTDIEVRIGGPNEGTQSHPRSIWSTSQDCTSVRFHPD